MLEIEIMSEHYDSEQEVFIYEVVHTLRLEHSLSAVSKWEGRFEKPFLNSEHKPEEILEYIRCMCVDPSDRVWVDRLNQSNVTDINNYIGKKMTATWFADDQKTHGRRSSGRIITAEIIYFWMLSYQIPVEAEHWHLKKLLTLIQVFSEENKPKKKMSRSQMLAQRNAINNQRLAQMGTTG